MSDYTSAEKILREELGFLRGLGFTDFQQELLESESLGRSLLLTCRSSSVDRGLEVEFFHDARAPGISLLISGDGESYFLLSDWMTVKKIGDTRVFLFPDVKEEAAFLRRVCSEVRPILKGPLRKTLLGQEWDSVPIDWNL